MFLAQPILIPPGQDPNFGKEGEESLVWAILLSNGLFIPLVTIVVALRIYTKVSMTKQVFLDDCEFSPTEDIYCVDNTNAKTLRSHDRFGYTLPDSRVHRCRRRSFGLWSSRTKPTWEHIVRSIKVPGGCAISQFHQHAAYLSFDMSCQIIYRRHTLAHFQRQDPHLQRDANSLVDYLIDRRALLCGSVLLCHLSVHNRSDQLDDL